MKYPARSFIRGIVPLAVLLLLAGSVAANTYYVDAARPDDTGLATNWATAKRTIQAAVDLTAASGDLVLVAPGEYKEGGAQSTSDEGVLSNRVWLSASHQCTVQAVSDDPAETLIVGAPDPATGGCGSNAVRCCASAANTARFIGFTLTNGYAGVTTGYKDGSGGGARGGTYSNCVFTHNTATGTGAYGGGSAYATLYNCVLRNNLSMNGGAMAMDDAYNCDMHDNTALKNGGACYTASIYGNGNLISNNVAGTLGGAGYDASFYNCMLVNNSALGNYGGAVYGKSVCSNCVIRGNSAAIRNGSAGYGASAASPGKFYNCLVTENHANWGYAFENYITLVNCTIVSNTCGWPTRAAGIGEISVYATNCIIHANINGGSVVSNYSTLVAGLTHCLTTPDPTGAPYDGGGNITGEPRFVNAAIGDYHLATVRSPGIDAGATVEIGDDLDGVARPQHGYYDMGCYEYVFPAVGTVFHVR